MLKQLRHIIDNKLMLLHKPGMIYGYKHKNIIFKDTRVSNTNVIDNPENLNLADNVFIGHYNFIEASNVVDIEEGCLIQAYSHVSGKFPDFSIIKGNPARIVGDTKTIDARILKKNPELLELYNEWVK